MSRQHRKSAGTRGARLRALFFLGLSLLTLRASFVRSDWAFDLVAEAGDSLMDVPFAGMNQGSKSIIGHIAIATILVAIMTWVLGGLGYLEGY